MTTDAARLTSAQRSLAVLEALATVERPLGVSELGRLLDSPRGTVHKQLTALAQAGWVEPDGTGRYGLSLTAALVGHAALAHLGLGRHVREALELIVHDTGETASVAALHRFRTRIVQRAESDHMLHADIRVGTEFPLSVGASSHVLAAFALTPRARATLRASGTDLPDEGLIARVREAGVARTVDELQPGISAVSVPFADPARDQTFALTLSAPTARIDVVAAEAALRRARSHIQEIGT